MRAPATDEELREYAVRTIETSYMKRVRKQTYIALEQADMTWDRAEVLRFRQMWENGASLPDISVALERHQVEVAVLILDQAERGKIKPRPTGLGI